MATLTVKELIDKVVEVGLHDSQLLMREPVYFETYNDCRRTRVVTGTQLIEEANRMVGTVGDDADRITEIDVAIQTIQDLDDDRFIWEIEE